MQINLLIIESDNFFRNNLSRRLPIENRWQILFAEHRIEALTVVQRKNIDVVLLCIEELKKEGLMILKEVNNASPLTEVITINRSDQIAFFIEAMKLGAFDDFIVPFDFASLVRRILDAYRTKKQNEKSKKSRDGTWQ